MWYKELLSKLLVPKIKKAEQSDTIAFLNLLFKKYCFTMGEDIDPQTIFGLVD